jgi:hypothetical protein
MTFGILGSGSWGTAIAKILTDNGQTIHWWNRSEAAIQQFKLRSHNPQYLPSARFNINQLILTTNAEDVIRHADTIVIAIPSAYAIDVLRLLPKNIFDGKKIISARKCDAPTFTLVDFDSYVSQTFNIIKTDRVDLGYLCALLNSSVISFWLRKKGKMQGTNYQIDKEPITEIPLFVPPINIQKFISKLTFVIIILIKHGMSDFARLYDDVVNMMIAQLYFDDEFKNHKVDVLTAVMSSNLQTIENMTESEIVIAAPEVANRLFLSDSKIRTLINSAFEISEINAVFN